MAKIEWCGELSVEVEEIDLQHRKFIELINRLETDILANDFQAAVGQAIPGILDYANVHFTTEEKYMAMFNYKGYSRHQLEHVLFRQRVDEMIKQHQAGSKSSQALAQELLSFLVGWLQEHLMKMDKKYVKCFKANGLA
jgi:hemerythrin